MLNDSPAVADTVLNVMEGVDLQGKINVEEDHLLRNIRSAVRRGYPQIRPDPPKADRIVMVGGGPSLNDPRVFEELRRLVWEGAFLVTLNGAYHWAIERNLRPQCQFVMDARPHNARFVNPAVPRCRYVLASQCHPDTWDAVDGRPDVWIFHAAAGKDSATKEFLDSYYLGKWWGAGGGTTVATRAISVLRTLGYLRFDLFGIDSCWGPDGAHHAYSQPENDNERRFKTSICPVDRPDLTRTFVCSPWHMKQVEDFLQVIRVNGDHFLLSVHGDGMISHLIQSGADAVITEKPSDLVTAEPTGGNGLPAQDVNPATLNLVT